MTEKVKRGAINGLDGPNGKVTMARKKFWTKNQPVGHWRNHSSSIKIKYNCRCELCKTYVSGLGYINVSD